MKYFQLCDFIIKKSIKALCSHNLILNQLVSEAKFWPNLQVSYSSSIWITVYVNHRNFGIQRNLRFIIKKYLYFSYQNLKFIIIKLLTKWILTKVINNIIHNEICSYLIFAYFMSKRWGFASSSTYLILSYKCLSFNNKNSFKSFYMSLPFYKCVRNI